MKEKMENIEKKNLIIAGVFIVSIIIILFGGALIYNKFFYKKSYSEVETIMLNATKSHFKKHEDKLPQNINDTITLTDDTLVKNEEMNSIASYLKDDDNSCTGEVTVTNINGDYRYTAMLDCGEVYKSENFMDYVKENVSVVTSGDGLYELNDELVYRGENVNNYIKLGGKTYRIVKFTDGRPVIIYTDKSSSTEWDDRYNTEKEENTGINNYEVSRMRDYLNSLYENNGEDAILTKSARLLVTQYDLAIGKRNDSDTDKTGATEKAKVLTEQYIGLLPISDFLNASLDANCTNTVSKSCSNYNYLSKYKYTWWTITASSENTYRVYRINDEASDANASSTAYVRPVFYLAKDAIYVSGDGSKANPFIIK